GGSETAYVGHGAGGLIAPTGLSFVPATTNVAVVDILGGAVHRYDAAGNALSDLIAPGGVLNNMFPSDVLFTAANRMWVANIGPNGPPTPAGSVMIFDPTSATPQVPLLTIPGFFASEFAIAPVAVPEPGTLLLV